MAEGEFREAVDLGVQLARLRRAKPEWFEKVAELIRETSRELPQSGGQPSARARLVLLKSGGEASRQTAPPC
jgi:hypothetical protein